MRPDKVKTIVVPISQSSVKLSSLTGMPKDARILAATCDNNDVNGTLVITVGIVSDAVFLAELGGTGGNLQTTEGLTVFDHPGLPIQWGEATAEALYLTSGSAAANCTVTIVTNNY